MVEAGYMPNVGRLIKRGVHREMWGVLPTLTPPGLDYSGYRRLAGYAFR